MRSVGVWNRLSLNTSCTPSEGVTIQAGPELPAWGEPPALSAAWMAWRRAD